MKSTLKFLSLSLVAFLSTMLAAVPSQAQVLTAALPKTRPPLAEVNCNLTGGPFLYFINTTLKFEGTLISQGSNIWFSADHVYCTQIKAPADCNTLKFFNGQVLNGQLISLPAKVRVTSVVLGVSDVSAFICN